MEFHLMMRVGLESRSVSRLWAKGKST